MKMTKYVAMAVMAAAFGATAASAQIRETQPAEFPPASYKGKQYVDSKGCVFIRAGIDGNVSWVPRVTRTRKVVCGFKPSTAGTQVAEVAPAKKAGKPPEQITLDAPAAAPKPAPKPRVAAAKPRPKVVRQTAPKPKRVVRKQVVKAVPKPQPAPAPAPILEARVVAPGQAVSCPGLSPLSQQYLRGDGRSAVRCGPQAAPIVGGRYEASVGTAVPQQQAATQVVRRKVVAAPALTSNVTDHTRIVPRHVAINRANTNNVKVPKGYRKVWEDGRLNPKRAEQTLSGRGHMLLVWTNTVPRRLIDPTNGKDVTATMPLVYPYIDVNTQNRELGEVTIVRRDGQLVKRVVRHRHATTKKVKRKPVYSTRSAPKKPQAAAPKVRKVVKKAPAVGGKRFVQIGLFSTKAKAQRAAQNLANLGMRAQMQAVRHKGKSYLSVKAGPFNGANATQAALSRLHGVGYTGARARN